MGSHGYRRNGGAGFAIDKPAVRVNATPSSTLKIRDCRQVGFRDYELHRLKAVLTEASTKLALDSRLNFVISGDMPTHAGFGSTTAVRLACLEILLLANNVVPDRTLLSSLSKRGGTSGIGINTYFDGGLIVDLGHPHQNGPARPSSVAETTPGCATPLLRAEMPAWPAGVVVPDLPLLTEAAEKSFFSNYKPLTQGDVAEILYHVVHGVVAGVLETNRPAFTSALSALQECAWKRQEVTVYGSGLQSEHKSLENLNAEGVAMSSFGPALFFIADDASSVVANRRNNGALFADEVAFQNTGRSIEW
jgi:beta-ribofuranosylaminobenzene 5'-phosphate synthase